MKRRRDAKHKMTWEDFEQRVALERTGENKDGKRSTRNAPTEIFLCRVMRVYNSMSNHPDGETKVSGICLTFRSQ